MLVANGDGGVSPSHALFPRATAIVAASDESGQENSLLEDQKQEEMELKQEEKELKQVEEDGCNGEPQKLPGQATPAKLLIRRSSLKEVMKKADDDTPKRDLKVKWRDDHGVDLTHIKEFEPSEKGFSDDELDRDSGHACNCSIQ
eukprot:TRINITY_DN8815_c0_g2_i2.p2 TRINITY_DN8815_c0_g2~~TRINITY_DN8815_c0_g2_i2.p2  ORF type:complete len:145 (+),score=46.74 TRINITY_DN8815_c0_g2_i2:174-608(+)